MFSIAIRKTGRGSSHPGTGIGTFHKRPNGFVVAGFGCRSACVEAWRAIFEIERPYSPGARLLRATPDVLLEPLRRIIPTLNYRIARMGG
jgi:hypothetical protein